jgi:hypothetical protein
MPFEHIQLLESALRQIAQLGGNLPDDRLTSRTGPNDAKTSRADVLRGATNRA